MSLHIKIILLCLLISFTVYSQEREFIEETRPKVGLCLSGGGARGLAHIGLLEIIDSLGIKVDYITGTSMGSVVGSLYSLGYTGKEIRSFMQAIDWEKLFSTKTDFSKINIEEKDEYQSYAVTLDVVKRKISIPFGFIEGQELQKTLTEYLYPSIDIHDFDSLPIPFRCIAADIYTGKKVILKNGNLTKAVRASMAIPLVFTPIRKDSMLLVDGGLVKNMPVDELFEMGADYIIGSYTGFVMKDKKTITSGIKLFLQTQSVLLVESSMEQAEKADVLVFSALENYSASDFDKYEEIMNIGKENAYVQLSTLESFANQQKKFINIPERKSIVDSSRRELLYFDTLQVIRENEVYDFEEEFALREFRFDRTKGYDLNSIFERSSRIYGTRFYSKIFFDIDNEEGKQKLTLNLKSAARNTISIAPRYENENGAGIGLTYTIRNKLLKNSRLTLAANLGDNLAGRIKYRKYIFNTNNVWFSFKALYERMNLTDFTEITVSNSSSAFAYTRNYLLLDAGVNYSIGRNLFVGIHLSLPFSSVKSKLETEDAASSIVAINLDEFITQYKSTHLKLEYNTLDDKIFPKKGWKIDAKLDLQFDFSNYLKISVLDSNTYITIDEKVTSDFISNFSFDINRYFSFHERLTLKLQTNANLNFYRLSNSTEEIDHNLNFENKYIGGSYLRNEGGFVNFFGYRQGDEFFPNHLLFSIGLRYKVINKFYAVAYANEGVFYNVEFKILSGGAAGFEYNSIIGPVKLYGQKSFKSKRSFLYLSLGYPF